MRTDLENFHATTSGQRPGRILCYASFVDDLQRRLVEHTGTTDLATHYGMARRTLVGPRRPADLPPLDFTRYWRGVELPPGTTINGSGVAMVPSGYYHFWGYLSPLQNATSLRDIEEFPLEDYSRWDFSGMAEQVRAAHADGRYAQAWVGHMYEMAWQIRGYEAFLIDLIENPAWAECLLERIFQQNLVRARAAAVAGADLITTGDDVASQTALIFSKDVWGRFMHSRWSKVWAEIKRIRPQAKIWYHSDGNIMEILDDLVEAGLDILNPVQPECLPVDEIYRRHGHRLTLDGIIGTQTTMPFGSPDDVRRRVREVIERYGREGGLIVSPTHVLEPEVPLENVDALFAACREFGSFEA